jgi:hypothetical protein
MAFLPPNLEKPFGWFSGHCAEFSSTCICMLIFIPKLPILVNFTYGFGQLAFSML